jgi:hypothetical protein
VRDMSKKNIWNNIFSMVSGVFGVGYYSSCGRIHAVSTKRTKRTRKSLDSAWDQAIECMDVETCSAYHIDRAGS